jgi:predicted lipid carrier protein YhbT
MRVDPHIQDVDGREAGSRPEAVARRVLAAPIDALLGRIAATLIARHPALADRLRESPPASLLVMPTDLPVRFLIETGAMGLALRLVLPDETPPTGTRISAPIAALLALAECRTDADAIFFDRTLAIDGDIEPVLALRNAIESESIDVAHSVFAALGPFAAPARRAGAAARDAMGLAAPVVGAATELLLRPVLDRLDALERAVSRLAEQAPRVHAKGGR